MFPLAVGAPMAWQEVRKGRGKGGSGVQASLAAMQNSIAQLAASISNTYSPQGKERRTSPGEGTMERRWWERQWEERRTQGGEPQTILREGHTHHGGNQVCGLPGPTTGPHAACADPVVGNCPQGPPHPENQPHRPRGPGLRSQAAPSFLLCGIIWLLIRQCCQRLLRPGRQQRKGQGPHDRKRKGWPTSLATLPESDPLREDFQRSARPAAQRSQRSASTRSQARFSHSQTAQGGGQGPEMQRGPQASRGSLAICPRRKRRHPTQS